MRNRDENPGTGIKEGKEALALRRITRPKRGFKSASLTAPVGTGHGRSGGENLPRPGRRSPQSQHGMQVKMKFPQLAAIITG